MRAEVDEYLVVPAAVGFVVMVMVVVGRVVVEVVGGVVVGGAVTVVALVDELGTVLGAAVDEPSTQFTFAGYTGNRNKNKGKEMMPHHMSPLISHQCRNKLIGKCVGVW